MEIKNLHLEQGTKSLHVTNTSLIDYNKLNIQILFIIEVENTGCYNL